MHESNEANGGDWRRLGNTYRLIYFIVFGPPPLIRGGYACTGAKIKPPNRGVTVCVYLAWYYIGANTYITIVWHETIFVHIKDYSCIGRCSMYNDSITNNK